MRSKKGSRPFSGDRDGFVLAEGSWMYVLEEYDMPRLVARKCWPKSPGYGSTARHFTGFVCRNAEKSPPERSALRCRKQRRPAGHSLRQLARHFDRPQRPHRTRALKLALGEERAHQVLMSDLKSQIDTRKAHAAQPG